MKEDENNVYALHLYSTLENSKWLGFIITLIPQAYKKDHYSFLILHTEELSLREGALYSIAFIANKE